MNRRRTIRTVGVIILAVNVGLALAKGLVWVETGSLVVGSEAINSVTDVAYGVVILAGLYLTTQPPDFEHPHGHERIEPLVSLFVALAIFAAGGGIVWQATRSILEGSVTTAMGPSAIVVLAVAGGAKYGLYRYCLAIDREWDSPAVRATGIDSRNDVLTAGAALVGVLGARAGFPLLDPLAAVIVAIGIVYSGWDIVRKNVDYLVGRRPPDTLHREIVGRALSHPDVEGVHDVIAHYVGPQIDVSLHVEVEGERTLTEAHEIESRVIASIRSLDGIDDVFVHVDPKELGEWKDDPNADRLSDVRRQRRDERGAK